MSKDDDFEDRLADLESRLADIESWTEDFEPAMSDTLLNMALILQKTLLAIPDLKALAQLSSKNPTAMAEAVFEAQDSIDAKDDAMQAISSLIELMAAEMDEEEEAETGDN